MINFLLEILIVSSVSFLIITLGYYIYDNYTFKQENNKKIEDQEINDNNDNKNQDNCVNEDIKDNINDKKSNILELNETDKLNKVNTKEEKKNKFKKKREKEKNNSNQLKKIKSSLNDYLNKI